ncbi:hypothetical protein [Arthrobacter sp. NPDC092385]|uniref:hypothetical protein n=1 Tax=Arthrobacter sp. NPDC092385 TaxID=3363943 RepID=UPI00380A1CA3
MSEITTKAFMYGDPKVFSLEGHDHSGEAHEIVWTCAYSPPDDDDDFRAIIGTLHGATSDASFTVSVGALFVETGVVERSDLDANYEQYLEASEALETLYSHARLLCRSVLAPLNSDADIPLEPPSIAIEPITYSDTDDAKDSEDDS